VAANFLGPTQDALDVYLGSEPDDVRGFGQLLARVLPLGSSAPVSGSVNALARAFQTGSRPSV
jgi:hypothetical protein